LSGPRKAGFVRQHHDLDAVAQAEFGEDLGDMGLDCSVAHEQRLANFLVRQSACHVQQHVVLAGGEVGAVTAILLPVDGPIYEVIIGISFAIAAATALPHATRTSVPVPTLIDPRGDQRAHA
jgi:hypothetical protein